MEADLRSDEELLLAYLDGETDALNTLLKRYYDRIWFFPIKHSWFRDEAYRDEVRQVIFLRALELIQARKFKPTGPGTFKDWLYSVARNVCYEHQRGFARAPKTLGKQLLDALPSDIESTMPETRIEEGLADASAEIERILGQLTEEERLLLRLTNEEPKKTYEEIQAIEPFSKYKLDNLRRKVCRIRKFLFEEIQKWQENREK